MGPAARLRALDRRYAPARTPTPRTSGRLAVAGLLLLVALAVLAGPFPSAGAGGVGGATVLVVLGGAPWLAHELRDQEQGRRVVQAVAAAALLCLVAGVVAVALVDRGPSDQECRAARAVLLQGQPDREALDVANDCAQVQR